MLKKINKKRLAARLVKVVMIFKTFRLLLKCSLCLTTKREIIEIVVVVVLGESNRVGIFMLLRICLRALDLFFIYWVLCTFNINMLYTLTFSTTVRGKNLCLLEAV